ncbi:MAG TPA: Hsp20/alpha crystallin family protein [Candidatus Coprenecus stercoripullorum]|nr:Hsp20/alpha crystallin family protein [Candidatus Coprenecus stercoripullorum]
MALVRRTAQNWWPTIFNDFFDDGFGRLATTNSPAINVIENEDEYKVEIAAPGMSKDDFKIRINEDNQLVVSLEKKEERKEGGKNEKYLRREFSYSQFEQALLLPDDIKKDKIEASMVHGVLNIVLPKDKEVPATPKERFIEIK